ncbi:uncharacterized protein LOC128367698 [Scomber scombrus]|uniref:Uncharacterized protein LOC128367698 n=1 Tax=Scomber scombrus TaxID=13677 RepID=A0AAV1NWN5_SCOSC
MPLSETHTNLLRQHILERLQTKLQNVISHPALDFDYVNFLCTHEFILVDALADQIDLPLDVVDGLRELCCLNSTDEADNAEDLQELDIDWETALYCNEFHQESGVVVPEFPSPLTEQDIRHLQAVVDPTGPSDSHGHDIYCRCLQIFQ